MLLFLQLGNVHISRRVIRVAFVLLQTRRKFVFASNNFSRQNFIQFNDGARWNLTGTCRVVMVASLYYLPLLCLGDVWIQLIGQLMATSTILQLVFFPRALVQLLSFVLQSF